MTASEQLNRLAGAGVKRVPVTIAFTTLYAAFYQVALSFGVSIEVVLALFFLSPFVVCYMAYVILRYGEPSNHTFEEKFYDDLDRWRIRVEGERP